MCLRTLLSTLLHKITSSETCATGCSLLLTFLAHVRVHCVICILNHVKSEVKLNVHVHQEQNLIHSFSFYSIYPHAICCCSLTFMSMSSKRPLLCSIFQSSCFSCAHSSLPFFHNGMKLSGRKSHQEGFETLEPFLFQVQ